MINKRQLTSGLVALPVAMSVGSAFGKPVQSKGDMMEKVQGIGGFFFRSQDPEALRNWYRDHLGIDLAPQFSGGMPWMQDKGFTVFDPFPVDDTMIPEGKTWMINFRVGDLAKLASQLIDAGIEVSDLEDYPHGRFASLHDPEGNGIQLWQPAS